MSTRDRARAHRVTAFHGESGIARLLIFSQVVLSLQPPFAVIPLIRFTSDRRKMGRFTSTLDRRPIRDTQFSETRRRRYRCPSHAAV
jgi:Mn2+/Fe2+ NRAMP family transporter